MQLSGSITALVTPFRADGRVDGDAWARLIERQITAGTSALVVAGSTGEAAMLDGPEYAELLRQAVAVVAKRVPLLAGTGHSGTASTVRQTRIAAEIGADVALVVTPPYVRPTQAGLLAHYVEVAENGDLPVLLYNVPSRTSCDLLPQTVAELAPHPRVVGIKEAVADPARMTALMPLRNDDFVVLSGDDPSAKRSMLAGASGCVSVASNLVPRTFAALCSAAIEASINADRARADSLDARLAALYAFLGVEPNPIPAKALLAALSLCHDGLRLPLQPLSLTHTGQLQAMAGLVNELEG